MMVTRLYQLPSLIPFLTKEIFEPPGACTTDIMDETPAGLVTRNDLPFDTRGFRERMKGYLIFPVMHPESFLSSP